jgi:hypothetical protein
MASFRDPSRDVVWGRGGCVVLRWVDVGGDGDSKVVVCGGEVV